MVGTPTRQLVIDGLVARGEPTVLADRLENPTGIWLGDYLAKQIVIRNADIEGLRTGIASPFVARSLATDPARDRGAILIENSRFRNYFGVVVGTAYTAQSRGDRPVKQAVVRASTFEPLTEAPVDTWMGWSIGRWDGDALVVDVTDQIDQTWFDRSGNFHSEALKVVERYTLVDRNTINYEATMSDPQVFSRPWKISMPLYRHVEKNAQVMEYKCVEFVEELMYGHLRKQPSIQ